MTGNRDVHSAHRPGTVILAGCLASALPGKQSTVELLNAKGKEAVTTARPSLRILEATPRGERLSQMVSRYSLSEIVSGVPGLRLFAERLDTEDLKRLAKRAPASALVTLVDNCADPEFLGWVLEQDSRVTVRRAVVNNPSCPAQLMPRYIVAWVEGSDLDSAVDATRALCERGRLIFDLAREDTDFRRVLAGSLCWRYPVSSSLAKVLHEVPTPEWGDLVGQDDYATTIILAVLESGQPRQCAPNLIEWVANQPQSARESLDKRARRLCSGIIARQVQPGGETRALDLLPWPELAESLLRSRLLGMSAGDLRRVCDSASSYDRLMKMYANRGFRLDRDSLAWICENSARDGSLRLRSFSGEVDDSAIDFIEESVPSLEVPVVSPHVHETLAAAVAAVFAKGTAPQRVRVVKAGLPLFSGSQWLSVPPVTRESDYADIAQELTDSSPAAAAWFLASWACSQRGLPARVQKRIVTLIASGQVDVSRGRVLGYALDTVAPVRALARLAKESSCAGTRATAAEVLAFARFWEKTEAAETPVYSRLRRSALCSAHDAGRLAPGEASGASVPLVEALSYQDVLYIRGKHPEVFASLRGLLETQSSCLAERRNVPEWKRGVLPDVPFDWSRARTPALSCAMSFLEEHLHDDNDSWDGAVLLLEDWTGSLRQLLDAARSL